MENMEHGMYTNEALKVKLYNFAKIGSGTTTFAALSEGVNNSLEATGRPEYGKKRIVTLDIVDGSKYSFTHGDGKYLVLKNSGTPVRSLERMMDNGYSDQIGDNHVFGVRHLYFLSKFAGESQEYYTYTKYDSHIEWISGPYVENPPHGYENLDAWPFIEDEWCVTATVVHLDDDVDIAQYEREFCKKYTMALINDPMLEIRVCGKQIVPIEPPHNPRKESVRRIVDSKELDAELHIYEYEAPNGKGSDEFRGITIFSCGVRINHFDTKLVQKCRQHEKNTPWNIDDCLGPHPSARPYATFIDIHPHSDSQFRLPYMSDKSDIDFTTSNGRILGSVIDNLVGDRFRVAYRITQENDKRNFYDKFLAEYENDENHIYLTEVNIGTEKAANKSLRIDGLILPIHDGNRQKLDKFTHSKRKRYTLSKEDFDGATDSFKLIEYKKASEELNTHHLSQLCDYADALELEYGIPQSRMELRLFGPSMNKTTFGIMQKRKRLGYHVEFVHYSPNDKK